MYNFQIAFLLIFVFISYKMCSAKNTKLIDSTKVLLKEDGFKLKTGFNLGVVSFANRVTDFKAYTHDYFNEVNSDENTDGAEGSIDLLSEMSFFMMLQYNSTIGIGAEVGRSSYSEGIIGMNYFYVSGFYIAPFVNYDKFRIGYSVMYPSSYGVIAIPLGLFTLWNDLPSNKYSRNHIAAFIRYETNELHIYDLNLKFPMTVYGKFQVDLQNPLYDDKTFRAQVTLGATYYFKKDK